jgi:hypothetical protein
MRPGDRLSKNSQLDLYLVKNSGTPIISDAKSSWEINDASYLLKTVSAITLSFFIECSSLLWIINCGKVISRINGLGYGIKVTYTFSSKLFPITRVAFISMLLYIPCGFFGMTHVWCIFMITLLALSFTGYFMAVHAVNVLDKMMVLENVVSSYCRAIKKVQLSLSGRELLHPLPPMHKLEEYLMRQYRLEDKHIAMSHVRSTLSATLLSLRDTIREAGAALCDDEIDLSGRLDDNGSSSQSSGQQYSTSRIQSTADDTFHRMLPLVLEMHIKAWSGCFSDTTRAGSCYSDYIKLSETFGRLYKMWLSLSHMCVLDGALDEALLYLGKLTYKCEGWSTCDGAKAFAHLHETGATIADKTDSSLSESFFESRTKLSELKIQLEDSLSRVYLCEDELAKVAIPLLAYSQHGGPSPEDTCNDDARQIVASLTRGDLLRVLESCRDALSILRGRGIANQTAAADPSTRKWNIPSEEQLSESVSTLSGLVQRLEEHHRSYVSSRASEILQTAQHCSDEKTHHCIVDRKPQSVRQAATEESNKDADETSQQATTNKYRIDELTSFGDEDSRPFLPVTVSSDSRLLIARLPIDVLTANVLSDAEIKVLDDQKTSKNMQAFTEDALLAQISHKLMTELGEQMMLSSGCREEVERRLDGAEGDVDNSVETTPSSEKTLVHSPPLCCDDDSHNPAPPTVPPVECRGMVAGGEADLTHPPAIYNMTRGGFRGELSCVLAAVYDNHHHFVHGDSSSDDESGAG